MRARIYSAVLLLAIAAGCKHDVEPYTSEALSDYLPLTVGKHITYQLDSTVYTNFGRNEEVHHYLEKQEVAAQLTDNLGQATYRIDRYLRDSTGSDWRLSGNFFITPSAKTVDVVENNLRTVRLAAPIKQGFSWKGNEYLPFAPYGDVFDFRSDTNFDPSDWEFSYERVGETLALNGQSLPDVLTVTQINEETNGTDNSLLSGKTFSQDKYAKGIGLVQQELVMWERQPDASGGTDTFTIGFGVKRTLLDHN